MTNPICFVMQEFDNGKFFDSLYNDVIKIAAKDAGAYCRRADEILGAKPPLEKIKSSIDNAAVCIAEVTSNNPNVFFELGWAFARERPTFVLWDKSKLPKGLPFNIHGEAGIPYNSKKNGWREDLRKKLLDNIVFELNQALEQKKIVPSITISELANVYLAYCKKHRSRRTFEWYKGHLTSFLKYIGDKVDQPASALEPFQVADWLNSQEDWGDSYTRGGITAIQVVYNWAVKNNRLVENPLKNIKKPKAAQRNNTMTPADYEKIRSLGKEGDVFHDVLTFSWNTDCRPEEIRHLEAKHIDLKNNRIRIPEGTGRAKQKARNIPLRGEAINVAARLVKKRSQGKLFLNERGKPWTKYAICNRLHRYSRQIGQKYALSDCRNGAEKNIDTEV